MDLKPQDLLVLLKVAAHPPQRWTYAALGEALCMSASEAHASVKRAVASGFAVAPSRAEWSPVRPNLLEFMLHGVRYVWPAAVGPVNFSNRWCPYAVETAEPAHLGASITIGLVSAVAFVAIKPEAFAGRGGDYLSSPDIEDVFNIVDGREELAKELTAAPAEIRQAVGEALGRLLADPNVANVLPGILAEPERAELVLQRLQLMRHR